MYSVAPLRLAWRGWGEIDNALLGGMILPLFGFAVQPQSVSLLTVLSFVPFTLLVFANLLATTWADRRADALVGKWTLATVVSPCMLRVLYVLTLTAACLTFVALLGSAIPFSLVWTILPSLPLMVWGALSYTRSDSPHASVFLMVTFMLTSLLGWGATGIVR